jgi:hypothetical protein
VAEPCKITIIFWAVQAFTNFSQAVLLNIKDLRAKKLGNAFLTIAAICPGVRREPSHHPIVYFVFPKAFVSMSSNKAPAFLRVASAIKGTIGVAERS